MKKLAYLLLFTASCGFAQTNYEWTATLRAVDEAGDPIMGANAEIGYYANSQPANVRGMTDNNGVFTASHSVLASMAEVSCQAQKPDYYPTWRLHPLGPDYDPNKWNFTETLVLKRVGKPIPMYAKRVDTDPPILGQPVGYDLMIGDWVTPYGKGASADIIFQNSAYRKSGADYEYKVKVTFPNSGDGIQVYAIPDAETGSGLRSPHEAPLDGYQPQLTKERSAHPGQAAKNDDDPNRIYLFRVRTILDLSGNVKRAFYGKIYGDFMQFTYYLNPTPNDRTIEFDPKHNLLRVEHSFERVGQP